MAKLENTRKGEELKKGTLMFLNFKFTQDYQSKKEYIKLFKKLYKIDPIVKLRGEKHISIANLFETEEKEEDGLPKLLYGSISTYNIIDPEAFYDREKKEAISVDLGEDVVSHFQHIDFYFSPEAHRLAFFAGKRISHKQVLKYFQEASKKVLEGDFIDITFESSNDVISRIINAKGITRFTAHISYSNRDEDELYKTIEEGLKADYAYRNKFDFQPSDDKDMVPQKGGMIESLTKLAQSNGHVEATIREHGTSKLVKINTSNHPMKEPIDCKVNELKSTIYNKIISIFRRGRTNN